MKDRIFFDNNATTKISPIVLKAINETYDSPLNPSSIHFFGRSASRLMSKARNNIKKLLKGENYEVVFTSGGTESNNLALCGLKNYQIITSKIEHPAIYNVALANNAIFVEVDKNGVVNLDYLEDILKSQESKDFIVSIMLANNETGAIQPVKEVAKLAHQYGGLVHSDIVQAVGKINIDLEELNVDMVSISSHKLNGPQGSGALLFRKGLDIKPILFGSSQESGKRPGTQNVAGIVGFGEACKVAEEKIEKYQLLANLRDYLENSMKEIAGDDLIIFSKEAPRLPNTSYIATKGIDNQTQLIDMDLNGIAISIGSACSSGSSKPSRILDAMGVEESLAKSVIRISFSLENTKEEVNQFIEVWNNLYQKTKN